MLWERSKNLPAQNSPKIHYKLENDWFAASNSQDHVDKFLSGTSAKNALADKISGHPFALFIDIQKIISSTRSSIKDSSRKAMIAASGMWQDMIATGGSYKDKAMSFSFEINLVDKNTNSLKQMNQYINNLYHINKERKNRNRVTIHDIKIDSNSITTATKTIMRQTHKQPKPRQGYRSAYNCNLVFLG